MGDKTAISWTDATLNALEGCKEVSAGCDHCYAASVALRFGGPAQHYAGLAESDGDGGARWTGRVALRPDKLELPLRWQRPRRVFVNSMSDLFYGPVPLAFVDRHFATFALAQRHTFQILTKRPARMMRYLNDPATPARVHALATAIWNTLPTARKNALSPAIQATANPLGEYPHWPLPNVWVGTSVESNDVLHRLDSLVQCEAATRFVSAEPLIGPLTLEGYYGYLDWVIVGGESGPQHRPMDLDWARDLRNECATHHVPFFYKQQGGAKPGTGTLLDGVAHHAFPDSVRPEKSAPTIAAAR